MKTSALIQLLALPEGPSEFVLRLFRRLGPVKRRACGAALGGSICGESAILAAVSLLAVMPASGAPAAACAPADPALAGHYYLRGVMEVGSELLLHADGRFEYMLAYGALDELASGCWTRNGGVVTLNVRKFENSMEDPMKFGRLELTVQPGGKLRRRFDSEHVGAYSR
ncbi:MAG TPA: hypothetical protein VF886_11650 [Roseiarcus sp.]